jgi:hypothetical protein
MDAVFDTLAYAKKLREAGFSEQQAEIQAEALAKIVDERLVTKEHLAYALKELEYRLTLRLGGMMAASIAIIVALVKLL